MRTVGIVGAIVALSAFGTLQGCQSRQDQIEALKTKLTAEQQKTATLEARVAALEEKSKRAHVGSWVLWERRKLLKHTGPGWVTGPTPAQPADAFDTKGACLAGAANLAKIHGAVQGQSSWIEKTRDLAGTSTDRVYFTCLPKGVPLRF